MAAQATREATALPKPITILNEGATRSEAEKKAPAKDGRLMSIKEFILAIKDPTQYERLKGGTYWTADYGLKLFGYCEIDYNNGELKPVSEPRWKELTHEQRAYACSGSGPVLFIIDSKDGRLVVDALTRPPDFPARVAYVGLEKVESQGKTKRFLRLGIKV